MKKAILTGIALAGAAFLALPAGVAYAASDSDDTMPFMSRDSHMQDSGNRKNSSSQAGAQAKGTGTDTNYSCALRMETYDDVAQGPSITDTDAENLRFMIEEEKLAHDLYVELGEAWELRVFATIATAEQQHMEAVRSLLDAYGLEDPTEDMAAGEFADSTLQDLYDDLLATGLASRTDALDVGGLVEETDILDLQARSSESVAIDQVFDQLEAASENHLRAFVTNLERLGVDYDAHVMSSADVTGIIGQ